MTVSSLRGTLDFAGSVMTLASGQLLAMAVPILAAPILGRLYLPAEYGAFALYVASASVLAVFATLQLQHAIIAARSERVAVQLAQLCIVISLVVSVTGAAIVGFAPLLLERAWTFSTPLGWIYLLPISVLFLGLASSIAPLANRRGRYREIAGIQVLIAVTAVLVAIQGGRSGWGASGLLAGQIAGQFVGAVSYLLIYRYLSKGVQAADTARMKVLFLRYRGFPFFTLPSELLGIASQQLPIFALNLLSATALAGSFSRAFQLVVAPITLIGMAVGQVFRQKASEDYRQYGTCAPIFRRTALMLLSVGLPSCVVFLVFAPEIFALYLGPNWYQAGEVARILAPMVLLRLVSSPLSAVFFFTEAQRNDAAVMLGAFCLCVSLIVAGVITFDDPMAVIFGFSIAYCLVYLVQFVWSYRLARGKAG
ncbi:MAG TPA: oligosaccharide flippase family protein [Hyphomonas sp.]|nr:oligosaccharide flippase family protein [Hyphomonas sp.]